MDYKKKYDEALERARKLKEMYPQDAPGYEEVFPELAESEDERIRRMCISAVNIAASADGGLLHHEVKQCLAWLEKQKENAKSCDSIPADCTSDAKCENSWHKVADSLPESKRLANEVIEYLTRHGYSPVLKDDSKKEHFHIDIPRHEDDFWHSEEYKHCRSVLGEYYMEGDYGGDTYTLYIWRAKKEQQPVEWSEEDERMRSNILNVLTSTLVYTIGSHGTSAYKYNNEIAWLKSLPLNLKKKSEDIAKLCSNEWSEEDERMRDLIVAIFEVNHPNGFFKANEIDTTDMRSVNTEEIISWLKSLRPQLSDEDIKKIRSEEYTKGFNDAAFGEKVWKPSKVFIDALEEAVEILPECPSKGAIEYVLPDLKKLI